MVTLDLSSGVGDIMNWVGPQGDGGALGSQQDTSWGAVSGFQNGMFTVQFWCDDPQITGPHECTHLDCDGCLGRGEQLMRSPIECSLLIDAAAVPPNSNSLINVGVDGWTDPPEPTAAHPTGCAIIYPSSTPMFPLDAIGGFFQLDDQADPTTHDYYQSTALTESGAANYGIIGTRGSIRHWCEREWEPAPFAGW